MGTKVHICNTNTQEAKAEKIRELKASLGYTGRPCQKKKGEQGGGEGGRKKRWGKKEDGEGGEGEKEKELEE